MDFDRLQKQGETGTKGECLAFRKLQHTGTNVTITVITIVIAVSHSPKQQSHEKFNNGEFREMRQFLELIDHF